MSGRKGFGVKADDLLDKLIEATQREVDTRQPDRDLDERERIANEIAVGALRYFMLKYTRNSIIAFDFKDALSFEGETGPYVQYAVVRARNIFRKAGTTAEAVLEALPLTAREPILLRKARKTFGRCGCAPQRLRCCWNNAYRLRSRRIWQNMPSRWRRTSTTSTTATTS